MAYSEDSEASEVVRRDGRVLQKVCEGFLEVGSSDDQAYEERGKVRLDREVRRSIRGVEEQIDFGTYSEATNRIRRYGYIQ